MRNKCQILGLIISPLLLFSCINALEQTSSAILKKRVWEEVIYQDGELVSERIQKVEYFDQYGNLTVDTLFFENNSGFERNSYMNNLKDTSLIKVYPENTYHTYTNYDSLGNGIDMTNVSNGDTTFVEFKNKFDDDGKVIQLTTKTIGKEFVTEFEYADSLLREKRTYEVLTGKDRKLLDYEKRYFDSKAFLIGIVVIDSRSGVKDSIQYSNNDKGEVIKAMVYSDGVLISTDINKKDNDEEIWTTIFHIDTSKIVTSSKSVFW